MYYFADLLIAYALRNNKDLLMICLQFTLDVLIMVAYVLRYNKHMLIICLQFILKMLFMAATTSPQLPSSAK